MGDLLEIIYMSLNEQKKEIFQVSHLLPLVQLPRSRGWRISLVLHFTEHEKFGQPFSLNILASAV